MARSLSTTISFHGHRERYIWPDAAINIWIIIMLATAGVLIGIFANFVVVQNHFQAPIPWYDIFYSSGWKPAQSD